MSKTTSTTIEDVYGYILEQYHKQKLLFSKNKEDKLFLDVARSKFSIWGVVLGYKEFGAFLSDINKIRKQKRDANKQRMLFKNPTQLNLF